MPTPIGHALAGLAVAGVAGGPTQLSGRHLFVLASCAVAPDLDLVLRLVDGVNHHRGASHSIGAAVLAGLVALLLRRIGFNLPGAFATGAAWASHVLLDFLGLDSSPPSGEMALWPLSTHFYISPVAVFYDVRRAFSPSAMMHNAVAVAIELTVLVPIAMICWRLYGRSRRV